MYLSKLEIFGFKSFANKTVINFTRGITGIVGPNGCGKTNIVDGIRWALGEQKSSMLRSDKMENVIFNGTRQKKPMGMAEISLTLVNDDQKLPTEYSEVTITRRIFRSGESEYLLNKNVCRLKDITNLFMDTGMGTNAYSVIELKMVETILSNRAEERRHMFEEAAGVNKYKLRRRLSLKKLDEVKRDLVRLNDIVAEVEKNVRSLQRQAKKADKYNQIQTVLREKEIELAEREFSNYTLTKSEFDSKAVTLDENKLHVDSEIRRIETSLVTLRDEIRQIEEEFSSKQSQLNHESEKLYEIQNKISVNEEKGNSLRQNLERFTTELEELRNQDVENEENIITTQELILEVEQNIEQKGHRLETTSDEIDERKTKLELKKSELKNYRDRSNGIHKQITQVEQRNIGIKNAKDKLNNEIESLNSAIQKSTNNIAKSVGFLEALEVDKENTQTQIDETDKLLSAKQNDKQNLEIEIASLREKELEEKNVLNSLRNKIELLQSMISNLEGVASASKSLIENDTWTKEEKTLFADVGNTNEKYRFALEGALKLVLNNLLVENLDDLTSAVKYLKNNDLGKASFYLLSNRTEKKTVLGILIDYSKKRKAKRLEKENGFISWTNDLVDTRPKWKPYFDKVLRNTALVETLEQAIELSKNYPLFSFATLNGDMVRENGVVDAGSSPKTDETLFGRKQMLEDHITELPKLEQNLAKLSGLIDEKVQLLNSINLNNISDKGKLLLNELNNIEKQISQLEFEKQKYSEEIETNQQKIQQLASEATKLDNDLIASNEELAKLKHDEISANEELAKHETELSHFENDYNNFIAEINKEKLDLERLRGKLQNERNELARLKDAKERIKETITKRESEIVTIKEETQTISNIVDEKHDEYEKVKEIKLIYEKEADQINARLKSVKEDAGKYESELSNYRNERQSISDEVHEINIKSSELKMKLQNIVEHIKDEYSLDIELKQFEDRYEFDFRTASAEVHDYKQRLKSLGPINLLAYSEYEEENERLEFLTKQRDDLLNSERDLVSTIKEINEAAEDLFLSTFRLIRENFIKIFQNLFNPGDEADLILQEGVDPLEAKIEILAKPKGKRPTSIELLSGGEKTLTATALLFAIYLVKPSPFCILDEVDAPLDDANIDRFTKLIKEFSTNTQFIIVTHNKRTMLSAENMYGVTMQEEGTSKLAAVQFNEDIKLN